MQNAIRTNFSLYIIIYRKILPYDVLFAQLIIVMVLSTDPIIPAIKAPMIEASKNCGIFV
jgi:hypothetical protein